MSEEKFQRREGDRAEHREVERSEEKEQWCELNEAERHARMFIDPVYFCLNIIPDYFLQEWRFEIDGEDVFDEGKIFIEPRKGDKCFMPWLHRGVLAILLRKTTWLNQYGELEKIQKNFRWNMGDEHEPQWVHIFKIHQGRLVFAINFANIQIMMPRGSAKTTLIKAAMVIKTAWQIVKFMFGLSAAEDHMVDQLGHIKATLDENLRFQKLFGQLRPALRSGLAWQDTQVELLNGVNIKVKGRSAKMRGMNKKSQRPNIIFLDDYEDEEAVSSEEQIKKTASRYFKVIKPMLPRMTRPDQYPPTIIAVNTLLQQNSLMGSFIKSPEWVTIRFGVMDVDGEPWWPEWMDKEGYEREKDAWALEGKIVEFHLEYDNVEIPDGARKFTREMFYYNRMPYGEVFLTFGAADPAISEKRKSDMAGIAFVSLTENGQFFVREAQGYTGKDKLPDKFQEHMLNGCVNYNPIRVFGIESNAYQAALVHLFNETLKREFMNVQLESITNLTKKTERVELALQSRYRNGYITHERRFTHLETQLLDWPLGKKDVPDALAMAVSLAAKHAPQFFQTGEHHGATEEAIEDLVGNWRLV